MLQRCLARSSLHMVAQGVTGDQAAKQIWNMSDFVPLCAEVWKMSLFVGELSSHPMGAKLSSVHTKTFSCWAETPTQKAFQRRSRQKGGNENTTRFCSSLNCLRQVTYRAILCHCKYTPHPAPQCVWVGGQVWFHLRCNTANYHSTEHKQRSLYLHNCSTENCASHDRIIGSSLRSVPDSLSPATNKPSIKYDSSLNSDWNHFISCSTGVSL